MAGESGGRSLSDERGVEEVRVGGEMDPGRLTDTSSRLVSVPAACSCLREPLGRVGRPRLSLLFFSLPSKIGLKRGEYLF